LAAQLLQDLSGKPVEKTRSFGQSQVAKLGRPDFQSYRAPNNQDPAVKWMGAKQVHQGDDGKSDPTGTLDRDLYVANYDFAKIHNSPHIG